MNNSYQGPPPKKQKLNIRNIFEEVKKSNLNTKEDKINYLKKYKFIEQDYNFLYNIIRKASLFEYFNIFLFYP